MKKQLLFTLAFLGAITFATAQTEASHDSSGADLQTFDVGQQASDIINDSSIVTLGGTGTLVSNNGFFGISTDNTDAMGGLDDGATGTIVFTITTDSVTPIDATLNLDMGKRGGCSVSGSVSVSGFPTAKSFAEGSNGGTTGTSVGFLIEFGSVVSLVSGSPLTVTITLDSMTNVDNPANIPPIFRLENVIIEKDGELGVDDVSAKTIETRIFPNPVNNSFQINSNRSIESVALYNITGRLVKTFSDETNYEISDLASGIYLARVSTDLGSKTLKVIKE